MSDEALIQLERQGSVAWLRLNLPERLNPLARPLQEQFRAALAELKQDTSVRALVVSGVGKAFCAGADLTGMQPPAPGQSLGQQSGDTMEALTNRLIEDLRNLPFPVLSAVNGPCAGGGVGVALAADVVVAARSAYFYLPFMPRLGIVPDLGSSWFLPRAIGRSRAVGLSLLGNRLSAEQAEQWGLVWACVDDADLVSHTQALALRLAQLPVHAAQEIRQAYDHSEQASLVEQLHYEASRQRVLIDKPDFKEGVRAFLEKREPQFPSR
jgi:2-(1,2-epoxy-1,2-dihydrophenyl)acetyl-CoA isomerase